MSAVSVQVSLTFTPEEATTLEKYLANKSLTLDPTGVKTLLMDMADPADPTVRMTRKFADTVATLVRENPEAIERVKGELMGLGTKAAFKFMGIGKK